MARTFRRLRWSAPLAFFALGGCVERWIQVRTDPPDATVWVDDQVVGKTPLDIPYTWYGKRLLAVERKGYAQVREIVALNPPWWQYFPLDFISENLVPYPILDRREFHYQLMPRKVVNSDKLLQDAQELRNRGAAVVPEPSLKP